MNAAFGGPGRDFAAVADYLFTTFSEMADAGKHVADIRERAAKIGREVGAYTVAHVVCRETQAEADAYYERYAVTLADHAAVDEHMAGKKEFSSRTTSMPTRPVSAAFRRRRRLLSACGNAAAHRRGDDRHCRAGI